MSSAKKSGKQSKKSTKIAAKSLTKTSLKTEAQVKRLTKKVVVGKNALTDSNRLTISKSTLSKWQQDQLKEEQSKMISFQDGLIEKSELEKVIEEIESQGSSSESEVSEEAEEDVMPELNLVITEDTKLLDFDLSSMEMSLSEDELNAGRHEEFENEINFLDILGKVPEVDEVSFDLLDEKEKEEPQQMEKQQDLITRISTKGAFFDPVTGLLAISPTSSPKSLSKEILTDEESLDENADEREKEDEEDDQLLDDISKAESEKSIEEFGSTGVAQNIQDNTFDMFMESVKPEEPPTTEVIIEDTEALMLQQKKLTTQKEIIDFFNRIIDQCVAKAEDNVNEATLRRSLDKYKLICELKTIYDALELERSKSQFLNKKTVGFFKRKGSFRSITTELPSDLELNRTNYINSVNNLDKWLNKEAKLKALTSNQINTLKEQFEEMKQQSLESVNKLEHLISTTFQRKNFDRLHTTVQRLIRKMSVIRKEISEVRFKLMLKQHQFSIIKTKLEELEDLGNGLNVRQYESLQRETTAISKKIEELSNTLARLHRHFYEDLHKKAHAKEKQSIIRNNIAVQKQFLDEVVQKQKSLRNHIHQLKEKRIRLKRETNTLMHQAGLLSNQVLLRDYDRTVDKANKLRKTNENLKKIIAELNSKIEKLT